MHEFKTNTTKFELVFSNEKKKNIIYSRKKMNGRRRGEIKFDIQNGLAIMKLTIIMK